MKNNEFENSKRVVIPSSTINETKDGYEIEFRIPGCGRDDVEMSVENRTLVMRADNRFSAPDGLECVQKEFDYRGFNVSVELPEHADADSVSGSISNGVLKVKVSKKPEVKPRRIEING